MSWSRIPQTTRSLLIVLLLISFVLFYFRITSSPSTVMPLPTPTPSPTSQPVLPSLTPTPITSPSPTLALTNPLTGWSIYQNTTYGFSFEYPPSFNISEYHSPQYTILIGAGENQDALAISITIDPDSLAADLFQNASPSAWTYREWQGVTATLKNQNATVTLISANKRLTPTLTIYSTYARSLKLGNSYTIDRYFKPILDSFAPLP